uniref:Uncharacterized protein n=1 Tax=Siphoviridae sp. cteoh1 TaxID=2826407 RepID=A0A8S5QLZ2_9CAUD|nr:MAG TPA: hypothetical protein [Siphoviridae sp. cteoh1]
MLLQSLCKLSNVEIYIVASHLFCNHVQNKITTIDGS